MARRTPEQNRQVYERRNAIAREQGFANYGEKRRALSKANESPMFRRFVGRAGGRRQENMRQVRLFYQAFTLGDPGDYSVQVGRNGVPTVRMRGGVPRGAKAAWLIDIAGYVDDVDEWRRRYPNGMREI